MKLSCHKNNCYGGRLHEMRTHLRHPSRREFVAGLAGVAAGALFLPRPFAAQTSPQNRIDVHCHFVPAAFLEFLNANYPDMPRSYSPPDWEVSEHIEEMDRGGVRTSILSLPRPGIWYGELEGIRTIARECNDANARLVADYPGRFGMFATLPLTDIEGSLRETEYALDTLTADGIAMKTPYENLWHGDPLFAPLYEELNRRGTVVYTHPQDATCCAGTVPGVGSLVPNVGNTTVEYGTNTTRTIASLLYSGTAARYPNIRWIFSHAGGTAPFLIHRFIGAGLAPYLRDGGVLAPGASEPRVSPEMPRGALYELQKFYYDTANTYNPVAMGALRKVVPVSQIVFGSDFPYGSPSVIADGLAVSDVFNAQELQAVNRDNLIRILPQVQ